ncbi:MAG: hypothetical protein ACYDC1_06475 [Limisphaerales bacterium]
MKPRISFRHAFLMVAAAGLWLSTGPGCSSLSYHRVDYLGVQRPSRTDPARVEILRSEPDRKFERLGEVVVDVSIDPPPPVEKIEAGLRREAAKMGADAVLLARDQTQVTGARWWGPYWAPSVSSLQSRIIVAVAIKYQ